MSRTCIALLLAALLLPAAAQARILPLERAHPNLSGAEWHYGQNKAPLVGITIDNRPINPASYPWSQVTISWDSVSGNVLVGCRGGGVETVRVWTHGAGWGLVRCVGHEPWRVVLRNIKPTVHLDAYVTFRMERRK